MPRPRKAWTPKATAASRTVRNAVGYVRVSTSDQAKYGFGLDAQRTAIEAHATARGWNVIAIHADEGMSGTLGSSRRPGLSAAIDDVTSGRADALIVKELSRVGRIPAACVAVFDALDRVNATFASIAEPALGSELLRGLFAGMAADERTRILERTSNGRIEKAKRGGVVGRPPYGYQIADARTEHARFIIDEAEAVIVRRIFQARREGQTFRAIADRLNADGVPSPSGRGAWSASRICQMVDQPIYIGTLRWREGDREVRTANAVPAILDTGFVPMFALPAVTDQADHGFGLAS